MGHHRINRSVELLLWTAAALCFSVICWQRLLAMQADHDSQDVVYLSKNSRSEQPKQTPNGGSTVPDGKVIGRLDIPALKLSVPMTAGIATGSLLRGVGHIEGTALPGGLGTVALAGHRDTYLRPLEHIAHDMDIAVTSRMGTYHYKVESWEIVDPKDVKVLSIRNQPELVLVTCYPFHYIGAAPQRFIVHARLESLLPDRHSTNAVNGNALPSNSPLPR
jgi:sortase A